MAKTYEPISTQTVGTATSTITFSSIPNTYTDLILVTTIINATSAAEPRFYLNNEGTATTNYSFTYMSTNGGSVNTGRTSSNGFIGLNYYPDASTSSAFTSTLQFNNYSNTTTHKPILIKTFNVLTGAEFRAGLWRSTSAINRIDLYINGGQNIAVGSTFTLYGIAAA
jgi:hypothetical protein